MPCWGKTDQILLSEKLINLKSSIRYLVSKWPICGCRWNADTNREDVSPYTAQMVGEEHFGGFLTRKTEVAADGKPKSWKERMEEIITQSKKLKVSDCIAQILHFSH